MITLCLKTEEGGFTAAFNERGLVALKFPPSGQPAGVGSRGGEALTPQVRIWAEMTQVALQDILRGRAPKERPPLDLSAGTLFQRQVWEALVGIPLGETQSYGEIAGGIGRPKACRAVGQACGANPIPLLVPCHRALAANGRIGGFSGGLEWKRRLLAAEGVVTRQP